MIHKHSRSKKTTASLIRNFTFGVEDSLVSTVGLLSGVAAAGSPKQTILTSGMVLIFVEAFSMAIGTLLSEQSAEEYVHRHDVPLARSIGASVVMFISYLLSGFIPLAPYIVMDAESAFWPSIILSLSALLLLGVINSIVFHTHLKRHALELLALGGIAIAVGVAVGRWIH